LPSRFQLSGHLVKRRAADMLDWLDSMDRRDSQPGLMS